MTPKNLSALAAASLIAVAAAGYSVSTEKALETVTENAPVFPGLGNKLKDVSELKLETNTRVITAQRKAGSWTILESGNYPANEKTIEKALAGLAALTYLEAKTRRPALYEKLEVRAPNEEASRGRRLSLSTSTGQKLADVILGRARYDMPGSALDGIYLRFPEKQQSWLALGQTEASRTPADWLQTAIIDIETKRIRQARYSHPDGSTVTVKKETETDVKFRLEGLPEGKKLQYESDPKNMGSVISNLKLNDVRPAADIDFTADKTVVGQFETFDGLVIDFKLIEKPGVPLEGETDTDPVYWVQISASASAPDKAEEAREITNRTQGWAYNVPAHKVSRLTKRMSEIITDK